MNSQKLTPGTCIRRNLRQFWPTKISLFLQVWHHFINNQNWRLNALAIVKFVV